MFAGGGTPAKDIKPSASLVLNQLDCRVTITVYRVFTGSGFGYFTTTCSSSQRIPDLECIFGSGFVDCRRPEYSCTYSGQFPCHMKLQSIAHARQNLSLWFGNFGYSRKKVGL